MCSMRIVFMLPLYGVQTLSCFNATGVSTHFNMRFVLRFFQCTPSTTVTLTWIKVCACGGEYHSGCARTLSFRRVSNADTHMCTHIHTHTHTHTHTYIHSRSPPPHSLHRSSEASAQSVRDLEYRLQLLQDEM